LKREIHESGLKNWFFGFFRANTETDKQLFLQHFINISLDFSFDPLKKAQKNNQSKFLRRILWLE